MNKVLAALSGSVKARHFLSGLTNFSKKILS